MPKFYTKSNFSNKLSMNSALMAVLLLTASAGPYPAHATASGTIYYVDFVNGSDTAAGTSPTTAWQHAPGDGNALKNPKTVKLNPGDEVLFKGGVVYQGMINIRTNGAVGAPIVYEGTGWGQGKAILSGLSSESFEFVPYGPNPALSVATIPAALKMNPGLANIVEIDGKVAFMANNSTSTSPYYPDLGEIPYPASEMTGSGTSWTFTDATVGAMLASLTPTEITNLILRVYTIPNNESNLTVTGFDPQTNALSATGYYVMPKPTFYTLYNNPNFISPSNPYPEYAVEGEQFVAAVTPGVHTVAVSTLPRALDVENSNIVLDGFDITGYGAGDGRGIVAIGGENVQITRNNLTNLATHAGFGFPAIYTNKVQNITISDNAVGPNIVYGAGISILGETNAVVTDNTITNPGWTAIVAFDDVDTTINSNRILNVDGAHACGIIAFDSGTNLTGGQQSQNVSMTNNLFQNDLTTDVNNHGDCGIAIEGDPQETGIMPIPDNFTVAYNVFFNSIPAIADWGKTNTANVYSNILLTMVPTTDIAIHSAGTLSLNVNYYNNIVSQFGYLPAGIPVSNETLTNNVAISSPKNVPPVGGNSYQPALLPVVMDALATPNELLPSSVCSILNTTDRAIRLGRQYNCAAP